MVKAMIESGITPDFIVVDGTEGGTGAAPPELSNHVGLPLIDGLTFVHNALVGAGLRDRIRIGASGKLVTGYDLCRIYALGADFAMIARGFMFAVGCIQARALPHQPLPDRHRHAGPDAPARHRRADEGGAGRELPSQHAAGGRRPARRGGARPIRAS